MLEYIPSLGTLSTWGKVKVFYVVQEKLTHNKQFAPRNTDRDRLSDTFLRCGFIVCGYCEGIMSVKRDTKGGRGRKPDIRYRCNRAQRGSFLNECKGASVVVSKINGIVWERIVEVIRNPSLVDEALKARGRQQVEKIDELTPIEKRIASVERKTKNYKRVVGTAEDEELIDDAVAMLNQLAKEKRKLESEKNLVLLKQRNESVEQESLDKFKQWCAVFRERIDDSECTPSYEENLEACEKLGVKVTVWSVDHAPRFKIEFSFGALVSRRST